jgi:hypothetical protein
MLYDRRWDKEVFDVYDTKNFVSWLGQQPKDRSYTYAFPDICAAAQYLKAHDVKHYDLSVEELQNLGWDKIVNSRGPLFRSTFRAAYIRGRGGRIVHMMKSIGEKYREFVG